MLARITELEMAAGRKWNRTREKENLVTMTRVDEHDGTFNALRNSTSGFDTEGPVDDNRVRKLLVDLENQSKQHIQEINETHEKYRFYVIKANELEERNKTLKKDAEHAIGSERECRRELKRVNL